MYVITSRDDRGIRDIDMIYTGHKLNHLNSFRKLIYEIIQSHQESTENNTWQTLSLMCPVLDFHVYIEKTKNDSLTVYVNGCIGDRKNGN